MKQLEDLREKQWNDLSTGTDEIQIINTQNVEKAKQDLKNLDYELTDAYGLGPNGYLNKAKELDNEVHGYEPKTVNTSTVRPQSTSNYAAPKNNFDADDWVMRGVQPPKVKPVTTVKPYDVNGNKPLTYYSDRDDLAKAPQRAIEQQINLKLDEIVHNLDRGMRHVRLILQRVIFNNDP